MCPAAREGASGRARPHCSEWSSEFRKEAPDRTPGRGRGGWLLWALAGLSAGRRAQPLLVRGGRRPGHKELPLKRLLSFESEGERGAALLGKFPGPREKKMRTPQVTPPVPEHPLPPQPPSVRNCRRKLGCTSRRTSKDLPNSGSPLPHP